MGLRARLEEEVKTALKAGRRHDLDAARLMIADISNAEKDKRRDLEDSEIQSLIRSAVKKRREAIDLFEQGGRQDLVEKEEAQKRFLEGLLPEPLTEQEIRTLLEEALAETEASSMRDLGAVMKWVMPRTEGRADGSVLSRMAKEMLSQKS